MMAFMGVLSSWLTLARNWDFRRLACSSCWLSWYQLLGALSDLLLQSRVRLLEARSLIRLNSSASRFQLVTGLGPGSRNAEIPAARSAGRRDAASAAASGSAGPPGGSRAASCRGRRGGAPRCGWIEAYRGRKTSSAGRSTKTSPVEIGKRGERAEDLLALKSSRVSVPFELAPGAAELSAPPTWSRWATLRRWRTRATCGCARRSPARLTT